MGNPRNGLPPPLGSSLKLAGNGHDSQDTDHGNEGDCFCRVMEDFYGESEDQSVKG